MPDTSSFHAIAGLSGSLLGLTTVVVALRYLARHRQKARLQADDWLMIPAWVSFLGMLALIFYGISQGFIGRSTPLNSEIFEEIYPTMAKVFVALYILSILAFGLVKLSALFFYRRIFCVRYEDAFSVITIAAIIVVELWMVAFIVTALVIFTSLLNQPFNPKALVVGPGLSQFLRGLAVSDFLLDLIIICIPIPKIWFLRTTLKRKIGISCVFLLAIVGLGASCTRMAMNAVLVIIGSAVDYDDLSLSNTTWAYFNILEAGLTIIAANLPSLYYYVTDLSPQRLLHSIRSIFSIRSKNDPQEPRGHFNESKTPKVNKNIV